jgi:bacterioferritin-associated ferredoxin
MIVCHCAVVTDRDLVAAVAGGARTTGAACRATSAGRTCGACLPAVRALVWQSSDAEGPCAPGGSPCNRSHLGSSNFSMTPSRSS